MAFITKNVSVTLLLCIVIGLALLIGSTVYYQTSLQTLNSNYQEKLTTLQDLEQQASQTTEDLNKAIKERELRTARGSKFQVTYSQLKSQEETAEALRDRRIQERADVSQSLAGSQKEYIDAKNLENQVVAQNQDLQIQLNRLVEQKLRQENTLRSLKNELDQLQQQLDKLKK